MTYREPITITLKDANDEPELAALSHIFSLLVPFDNRTRQRMLTYICDVFPDEQAAVGELARRSNDD